MKQLMDNATLSSLKERYREVEGKSLLWHGKALLKGSFLVCDLENIGIRNMESIKRLAKFTPERVYAICKETPHGDKLALLQQEGFILFEHYPKSADEKIMALIKVHQGCTHLILVSSDSDFVPVVTEYLKGHHVQWILSDATKKRVYMKVNLTHPRLSLNAFVVEKCHANAKRSMIQTTKTLPAVEHHHGKDNLVRLGVLPRLFMKLQALKHACVHFKHVFNHLWPRMTKVFSLSSKETALQEKKREMIEKECITRIRCDICGYVYEKSTMPYHQHEMIHLEHAFGYESSFFEDMSALHMNICEKCLYDFIKSHGLYPSVIKHYGDTKCQHKKRILKQAMKLKQKMHDALNIKHP